MTKKIYIKFGHSVQLQNDNWITPATLTIFDDNGRLIELHSHLSEIPKTVCEAFHEWRTYIVPDARSARTAKFELDNQTSNQASDTSRINFEQIANNF